MEVDLEFLPDCNDTFVRAQVARMEGDGADAWRPEEMGPRYDRLIAEVVAFRAHVRRTSTRFKLGQDEDAPTFDAIVTALSDTKLAGLMVEQRQDADEA